LVSSPQLDAWLGDAVTTSDAGVAKQDYANVQNYVLKNAYALPLYADHYVLGATAELHGVRFDTDAEPLFYDAWLAE
jgi:peptide/nickel transport system substrate-binding protein